MNENELTTHASEHFGQILEDSVNEIFIFERKDGSCYAAEIHLQFTQFEGKPSFVAIVLDVTARLKAEELVRVQQAAINASSNGVVITDASQPDNPIFFVNPAFFETTKARGIGLGLALSQRYARLNFGKLEVESALGIGSTFTLTLPSVDASSP